MLGGEREGAAAAACDHLSLLAWWMDVTAVVTVWCTGVTPVGGGSEAFSVLKTRGTPCGSGNLVVVVKKDLTQCKQEEEEEDCRSLSAALCTLSLSRGTAAEPHVGSQCMW